LRRVCIAPEDAYIRSYAQCALIFYETL
jgi:hypothetical protein